MPDSNRKLCCFVTPYFGKLPLTMPAFLKTVEKNPGYNWLIFTDDHTEYSYPENVLVKYCTFDEMVERIQKCYDFKIKLPAPYKLCDFKPAYGHIFADELQGYEFWGHCDLDEYFGDLSRFIPQGFLRRYDKLFAHGHMTIFRNTEKMNLLYQTAYRDEHVKWRNYREAFSTPAGLAFDELDMTWLAQNAGGGGTVLL